MFLQSSLQGSVLSGAFLTGAAATGTQFGTGSTHYGNPDSSGLQLDGTADSRVSLFDSLAAATQTGHAVEGVSK